MLISVAHAPAPYEVECGPLMTDRLRISVGLFHHVLVYMGDLHLVLPLLNLCIMDAGILIMVQQVSLMMFFLNMVD